MLKVTEIAGLAGMKPAAAGELIKRFEHELKSSKDLSGTLKRLEKTLCGEVNGENLYDLRSIGGR